MTFLGRSKFIFSQGPHLHYILFLDSLYRIYQQDVKTNHICFHSSSNLTNPTKWEYFLSLSQLDIIILRIQLQNLKLWKMKFVMSFHRFFIVFVLSFVKSVFFAENKFMFGLIFLFLIRKGAKWRF